jgi:hypothetical protein
MLATRPQAAASAANDPVELLYLPPASLPRIRAENAHPKHMKGDTAISLEPLLLGSTGTSLAPSASAANGSGSGVDWKAEARRAVQAFEIRNHEPGSRTAFSRSPAEDWWWPRSRHAAGDQYKTPSGDWIVWIDSNCYQVAEAGASGDAPGALLPETLCPGAAHDEAGGQSAESKKARPPQ